MSTTTNDDYTPQERAKDKRLQKNYGWTLRKVQSLERIQEGRCGICGRVPKPGGAPLNVDHIHFRVTMSRCADILTEHWEKWPVKGWKAEVLELDRPAFYAKTKVEAHRLAYDDALPHSVRGLLCAGRYRGCNRLLGRIDNIRWLEKTLAYLRNPPAKKLCNQ